MSAHSTGSGQAGSGQALEPDVAMGMGIVISLLVYQTLRRERPDVSDIDAAEHAFSAAQAVLRYLDDTVPPMGVTPAA